MPRACVDEPRDRFLPRARLWLFRVRSRSANRARIPPTYRGSERGEERCPPRLRAHLSRFPRWIGRYAQIHREPMNTDASRNDEVLVQDLPGMKRRYFLSASHVCASTLLHVSRLYMKRSRRSRQSPALALNVESDICCNEWPRPETNPGLAAWRDQDTAVFQR